jgi:hypothetical protein
MGKRTGYYFQVWLLIVFVLSGPVTGAQAQSQQGSGVVFRNQVAIGRIDSMVPYGYDSCYLLQAEQIQGKQFLFKIPVSANRLGDQRFMLVRDFELKLIVLPEGKLQLQYRNTVTSEYYEFSARLVQGRLALLGLIKTANAAYHYQLADQDFADKPATLICRKDFGPNGKLPPGIIALETYFPVSEKSGQCFYCPLKYTLRECLDRKKQGLKFDWEE